jgi:hypothetical protein
MSDTPSIVTSALAMFGSVTVALIQRGTTAATKEAREQIQKEIAPRIAALEESVKQLALYLPTLPAAEAVTAAAKDAAAALRQLVDLRVYVESQLREARRTVDSVRRESLSDNSMSEVANVAAAVTGLERRVAGIEDDIREDRRAEGSRQRELGELMATLKMLAAAVEKNR